MAKSLNHSISVPYYVWSVRAFSLIQKRLGMKIAVHADSSVMHNGQIFLFNHFARFETLVPQYFIYKATGAYCRCVAAHELFDSSERFAGVLWSVGAVPNNHPGLLAFLAAEILRGQKVIFFPEGSMMKDRSIAAPPREGLFDTFKTRNGHKQGAAALAVVLELFKKRILLVEEAGDTARLDRWVAALGLAGRDALFEAVRKPTLVVPSNITFHPIHRGENFLLKAADFLKFNLGRQGREELMVEGNLLLRKTDMDIRFGRPIHPDIAWTAGDRLVLAQVFEEIDSLDDLFGLKDQADHWTEKLAAGSVKRATRRLRDHCMVEMYANVTLNISHIAARMLMRLAAQGETAVEKNKFHAILYAAIKLVQNEKALYLHQTLTDPNMYGSLPFKACDSLEQFYATASEAALIDINETHIKLLPALLAGATRADPRLANVIKVYANEIESLTQVIRIVETAQPLASSALGEALFLDELRMYSTDRAAAQSSEDLGEPEKKYGAPYLMMPKTASKVGVVLVHGFLASPAELKTFAERLVAAGHPVLGVRLKGHGTTPQDLRRRSHVEWMGSVKRGYEIMSKISDDVALVGFATGASLGLLLATEQPKQLVFVAAVSAPLTFRLQSLWYSPLLHRLNKLGEWMNMQNGIKPYQERVPEHPDIEYRNMPVQALMELHKVASLLAQKLSEVHCQVMIIQGDNDPVVDPESAKIIEAQVGSVAKSLHFVRSDRHGILCEDTGGVQDLILEKLAAFELTQRQPVSVSSGVIPRIGSRIATFISRVSGGKISLEPK